MLNNVMSEGTKADKDLQPKFIQSAMLLQMHLCVSSEAAFVMRVGLSVGEAEQPSPSNRLYAA